MGGDSDLGPCCSEGDCGFYLTIGLLTYYLFSPNLAKASSLSQNQNTNKSTTIEEVVKTPDSNSFLVRQIENYQKRISPIIKERRGIEKQCKFEPSCSDYAHKAIEKYGSLRGSLKAAKRLLKCNQFSKGGYDPVK